MSKGMEQGKYRFGPESARLLLRTSRTGLGRRAGHDLTIEVTRWSAEAVVDPENPDRSSLLVEVEVDSIEPREGTGGIKPLTDADRAEIKRTATQKILRVAEHPTITFRSTRVSGMPDSFSWTRLPNRGVRVIGAAPALARSILVFRKTTWRKAVPGSATGRPEPSWTTCGTSLADHAGVPARHSKSTRSKVARQ